MFDFGFSELVMIGIVALVVLGPERLPTVARTAGQWLGKAQRMVQQVKSDIEREAELSELKKIQEEAKGVADDLTKTIKGEAQEIEKSVNELQKDVDAAAGEMTKEFNEATKSPVAADLEAKSAGSDGLASAFDSAQTSGEAASSGSVAGGETSSAVDDFYGWYSNEEPYSDEEGTKTTFERRYKCGPSIDELAEQVERLKAELGDRSPQLGGTNRRFAVRARTNRVRIYR